MIASSAANDLGVLNRRLPKAQPQIEGFRGGQVSEDERARPAWTWFGGKRADALTGRPTFSCDILDQREPFSSGQTV